MIYENNEQLVIELKKAMLNEKVSQKEIAEKLGISPQNLTKTLTKKNINFDDLTKILSTIGYEVEFNFVKKGEWYD